MLTASFAYDNFDMEFKSHTPTIEKHRDSLKHATSAIIFLLINTSAQDLMCSDELWRCNMWSSWWVSSTIWWPVVMQSGKFSLRPRTRRKDLTHCMHSYMLSACTILDVSPRNITSDGCTNWSTSVDQPGCWIAGMWRSLNTIQLAKI